VIFSGTAADIFPPGFFEVDERILQILLRGRASCFQQEDHLKPPK
jgi:hypothetical protein